MKKRKNRRLILPCVLVLLVMVTILIYKNAWGFARQVSKEEKALRLEVVHTAESWLGAKESDGSHRPIIDIYNSHEPLARGYPVTYEDAWCSAFVSTAAIQCGLTDIIPTECGCDCQIDLLRGMHAWVEADDYVPLPGDLIFYHWECEEAGDCDHWSDHVGIVVGTCGSFIKVIEGNKDDDVSYRITKVDASHIRGYGIPDYANKQRTSG